MLRTILVPLDGTHYDKAPIEYGLSLARRFHAELIGLGIVNDQAAHPLESVPIGGGAFKQLRDERLSTQLHERIADHLAAFQAQCARLGVECSTIEAEGSPLESIIRQSQRCDLIVSSSKSHFTSWEEESCDTIDQLVRMVPRPVIAVPDPWKDGPAVVIAYDGSLPAMRALQALELLGLAEGRPIHVITVGAEDASADTSATAAAEFLVRHGLSVEQHLRESPEAPLPLILEEVERLHAGLLVMGSHGQAGWREWLFGSSTRWALKNTSVPLMLYR